MSIDIVPKPAEVGDPDGRRAWAHHVAAELAALPARQADALRMLYFEHLTDCEVAARLGVSLKRARATAADGMRSLGAALLAAT